MLEIEVRQGPPFDLIWFDIAGVLSVPTHQASAVFLHQGFSHSLHLRLPHPSSLWSLCSWILLLVPVLKFQFFSGQVEIIQITQPTSGLCLIHPHHHPRWPQGRPLSHHLHLHLHPGSWTINGGSLWWLVWSLKGSLDSAAFKAFFSLSACLTIKIAIIHFRWEKTADSNTMHWSAYQPLLRQVAPEQHSIGSPLRYWTPTQQPWIN